MHFLLAWYCLWCMWLFIFLKACNFILKKRRYEPLFQPIYFLCIFCRRQSLPLSGLSTAQLTEHYTNCIKLSTENVSTLTEYSKQLAVIIFLFYYPDYKYCHVVSWFFRPMWFWAVTFGWHQKDSCMYIACTNAVTNRNWT